MRKPLHTVENDTHLFLWEDAQAAITVSAVEYDQSMRLWARVRAESVGDGHELLNEARFNLLDQQQRTRFATLCAAKSGQEPPVWDARLLYVQESISQEAVTERAASNPWEKAISAQELLQTPDAVVDADVRDFVVPGCITLVAAPRASGKSLVALYLGIALATGGMFRDEKLPQRRVLLVDRDNPHHLVKKRLRWLGAQHVTELKVLTRDHAPPLTDRAAWAQFPVSAYDVVIIDSIGASTEGVSEREGKQTQEFLAVLKDLARRGPAVLGLDNTVKSGENFRGRGEKADAVDILYEARNITGWTPAQGDNWWESLPEYGEHTWQQRASRRKGQTVLRVAFIPSKFRLGIEPEPFALEITTTTTPWSMRDITDVIAKAGEDAAQAERQRERQKLEQGASALVHALRERSVDTPMLKSEGIKFLQSQGLSKRQARSLVEQSGNQDIFPGDGQWKLRPIPGRKGDAIGIYLAEETQVVANNPVEKFPSNDAANEQLILATRIETGGQNTGNGKSAENLEINDAVFWPLLEEPVAKIDTDMDKILCGSPENGIICHHPTYFDGAGVPTPKKFLPMADATGDPGNA